MTQAWLMYGATSLLAVGLYLNTLSADFAYDDSRAIQKNPDLLQRTPLINLLYNDFWGTPLVHSGSHKSYRPLCVLTFRLNHLVDGLNPFGYHLVNVILHACVTALFARAAQLVLARGWPSLLAATLFAVHPIHTESVAGIVGRADILACLFFLLALLAYAQHCQLREKPTGYTVSSVTLLLATNALAAASMLSKEHGITVLAVCAVYDVFIFSRLRVADLASVFKPHRRAVLRSVAFLGLNGVCLLLLRLYFMGNKPPEFAPADNPASDSSSLLTRTLTFNYLLWANIWLLLCPATLSFDWSMEAVPLVQTVFDYRNLLTLSLYGSLVYVTFLLINRLNGFKHITKTSNNGNGHIAAHVTNAYGKSSHSIRRRNYHHSRHSNGHSRRGSSSSNSSNSSDSGSEDGSIGSLRLGGSQRSLRAVTFGLAMMTLTFLPATNLFFYVGFVIAERVLYIPSMGFCILVAEGAYVMARRWANGFLVRMRVLRAVLVVVLILFSARTVIRNVDWSSEESLYRAGIAVNPAKAWGNLANILNHQGNAKDAEDAYRSALKHRGNMADVHYNLGILLQEQQRLEEAVESYEMAIKCRPRLTMAYLNLGIVLASIGKKEKAEQMYRHCTEIDISGLKDPRLHEHTKISALYNLGRLLADVGRLDEAVKIYLEAVSRRPAHYQPQSLYNMLGEAYFKLDNQEEALKWYQEALRVKPDHVPAHLTMAKLAHRQNRLQEAEDWFQRAIKIDQHDGTTHQHYGQFLGETKRHHEAAQHYLEAVKLVPDDFELVFNTANALREAGLNQQAEHFYQRAANLKPHVATAHMNLGAMLHYNGKLPEAEASYLEALRLKPNDDVTRGNLRKLRNLLGGKGGRG